MMEDCRPSIKQIALTDTYWHDRNGQLRLGINAKLRFLRIIDEECVWGIDDAFVSKPNQKGLLRTGLSIPESLFSIEQVDSSDDDICAVLSFNTEAYDKQDRFIKRTIEKVWRDDLLLYLKVRLNEDLGELIRVKLRSGGCCSGKEPSKK